MYLKCVTVFVGAILLASSSGFARPRSWNELTRDFLSSVATNQRTLKPNLQRNIEIFFSKYIDSEKEQLLHVETQRNASDTILDFLAFNCYGILKQVVPRDHPGRDKFLQLAVEHLFDQALLRLDRLSYFELCRVVHASLVGKYSIMTTLTDKGHFAARDRLMYFLIERSSNRFESLSGEPTLNTPSLAQLTKQAIGAREITLSMQRELAQLMQPQVQSWEEIEFIDDFFGKEMERKQREKFLTQVMDVARNVFAGAGSF